MARDVPPTIGSEEFRDPWCRLAAGDTTWTADAPAVALTAKDHPAHNVYWLEVGPQRLLHSHGPWVHELLRDACGFERGEWGRQRLWLERAFRDFFRPDLREIGWYSLLTARRPAGQRPVEERHARVSQDDRRVTVEEQPPELQRPDEQFGFDLDGIHWANPEGEHDRHCHLANITVPRRVTTVYGIDAAYSERWATAMRRGCRQDLQRMQRGQIPSVAAEQYVAAPGLRTSIILNLVKLVHTRTLAATDWVCIVRPIELRPKDGAMLSVRQVDSMRLADAAASWSGVEPAQLQQVLNGHGKSRVKTWPTSFD